MDTISLMFYGAICASLSLVSPRFSGAPLRLAVGAGVGVIAASILPAIRSSVGY